MADPLHPIYVVSKGRHESRLTVKALDRMGVEYFVVVEEQELELYAAHIERRRLLVLDKRYQREYDTFDDLGDSKSKGPGAARNFAWDHALSLGAAWHWVMDDNIFKFMRFNKNLQVRVDDGAFFRAQEDFCLRYTNVAMAGPNYYMFAPRKVKVAPFVVNTRIYSCNLIRNDVPYRWRGRYNEDTDLSLRMLKDGWCTIQFNAFLQHKAPTQTIKGGNTADFYSVEGTRAKSEMQVAMHPDVSKVVHRFGRIHHHVDYSPFKKNILRKRPDLELPAERNEYGMKLVRVPLEDVPVGVRSQIRKTRARGMTEDSDVDGGES